MKILLGLASMATLASVALADITYNVVGYRSPTNPNGSFGVSINGAITKLAANETTFPVWMGVAPGSTTAQEYKYVELDSAGTVLRTEPFARKFVNLTDTSTLNEFFERPTTIWDLPHIPYTYLATWPSKTKAFKHKQIATIHVTAPAAELSELLANPENGKEYKVNFRFINSKTIYSQNNITFATSGKSSKDFSKQAFKFEFDTDYNQTFFSRPNLKLRSMVQDPTMMREKLYIDMLNSVGIPTQQGAWVRLFVNEEPYGLFLMVDDIKKSFLKQTVHGGDPAIPLGALVQMNAWKTKADLVLNGTTTANYDPYTYISKNLGNSPAADPLQELITFMTDLQAFDPAATPSPVEYWTSRLDLDGFLRNMALEYLMGAFDCYWYAGSNYFMYKNLALAAGGKWQWLPTDFDGTFGNGYPYSQLPSYRNYTNFAVQGPRPLVSKLILDNKEINAKFEQTLKEIVSTAFKPEALLPRIQMYNQMLALDAAWDYSLSRKSPGDNNNYTIADFNDNVKVKTRNMQFGLEPWVNEMSTLVATQLGFTIPAGLADRVAPPPKTKRQGGHDSEDDDEPTSAGLSLYGQSGLVAKIAVAVAVSMVMSMAI